jgi:hypothetical protein
VLVVCRPTQIHTHHPVNYPVLQFDLLKLSLPVKLFEPRSYLQKLADPWVYPRLLRAAAEATSPEERLKWTAAFFIAGACRICVRLCVCVCV